MNKYWFYKVGLVVVFLCFALLSGAKVKLSILVADPMGTVSYQYPPFCKKVTN